MEGKITVEYEGNPVSALSFADQGVRRRFSLSCPQPPGNPGVLKLWLTNGAAAFLLGTPQPVGNRLTLCRTVSLRELSDHGVLDAEAALLISNSTAEAPSGQKKTAPVPEAVTDAELRQALSGSGFTLHQAGNMLLLQWRWRPGEMLPAPPLAVLMSYQAGVLTLALQDGWPVVCSA